MVPKREWTIYACGDCGKVGATPFFRHPSSCNSISEPEEVRVASVGEPGGMSEELTWVEKMAVIDRESVAGEQDHESYHSAIRKLTADVQAWQRGERQVGEPAAASLAEALLVAADDLDKAANQFAAMRESQKAGHNVQIQTNPEKFADKAARARRAASVGEG